MQKLASDILKLNIFLINVNNAINLAIPIYQSSWPNIFSCHSHQVKFGNQQNLYLSSAGVVRTLLISLPFLRYNRAFDAEL